MSYRKTDFKRAEGYIPLFVLYLIDKKLIENNKLDASIAKEVYTNEFKQLHDVKKFSFSNMVHHMRILRVCNNRRKMKLVLNKEELKYITKNGTLRASRKTDDPADDYKLKHVKPVIVNQNVSFKHEKENLKIITEEECSPCKIKFNDSKSYNDHIVSVKHLLHNQYATNKKSLINPIKNLGIETADGNGRILKDIILSTNIQNTLQLNIINSTKVDYEIVSIIELKPATSVTCENILLPYHLRSKSRMHLTITALFTQSDAYIYPVVLEVKSASDNKQTFILKELIFHVHSQDLNDLHPTTEYKRTSKPVVRDTNDAIIHGERLENDVSFTPAIKLEKYELPDYITKILNSGLKEFNGMTKLEKDHHSYIKNLLDVPDPSNSLAKKNYCDLLDFLLYAEEHQMNIDIRQYDKFDQELTAQKGFRLELEVPGLAEHRPSLIVGDSVFIKQNKEDVVKYEGVVHRVQEKSVILGFSKKFVDHVHVKGKKYMVSFTFNRVPLKVEHQAVSLVRQHNIISHFFPEKITRKDLKSHRITWFNKNIENNEQQQQAVRHIISKTSHPAPYLVFGPPGTGKTMTIVEAIMQIWRIQDTHNILICAPSNNAADEITKRLIRVIPKTDLFRIVAKSYPFHLISDEVKPYVNYLRDEFYHPSIDSLKKYRIVIVTLVTAARLVNGGIPHNHFSYVFIDESGHATETETLIPIAGILSANTNLGTLCGQVVLVGDPKQLGPIIHSNLAKDYGFATSMLERFMNHMSLYQKGPDGHYDSAVLTKLLKNYRSHSKILEMPNKMFYDGELEVAGEMNLINIAVGWEHLPNPKFPIIFHSVIGKDQREGTSPSFFNVNEIEQTVHYLGLLIGCTLSGMKIKEEHIAIITPYRKQVQKMQKACKKYNWKNVMIGSVEQLQGQERLIIIVSTVRSKPEFMSFDEKFHLGFLRNPKRFNVAITRAKALLIVIGNPNILQHDEHWYSFIKYCKDNNAVGGKPFQLSPPAVTELSDVTKKLSYLSLNGIPNHVEDAPNFSRGNV